MGSYWPPVGFSPRALRKAVPTLGPSGLSSAAARGTPMNNTSAMAIVTAMADRNRKSPCTFSTFAAFTTSTTQSSGLHRASCHWCEPATP
ncbi:Uncharacterised protein [Mycobacteroides abscessus subsp. abscessus]|nr:Uncharacterised protein [Mycobacteroides abscessus subsp. abscessus]